MKRIVMGMMSVALCLSAACEQRKGTLLPPRPAQEARSTEGELRARAPIPSAEGEGAEDPLKKFAEDETQELERVKQSALDRLRSPDELSGEVQIGRTQAKSLYERGRSLAAEGKLSEAQEFYLVACQYGHIAGCHKFGWHEQQSGNTANAGQFYRISCEAGISKSCNNLGVQMESQKRWEDALNYYAQACLEQHSVSCENLKRLRSERMKVR